MSYMLRIETELGGPTGGVSFVKDRSAIERDSLVYGRPVKLALIQGTRQISSISTGRVQETFTVFSKSTNSEETQVEVSRLTQILEKAGNLTETKDTLDRVYLVEKMENESSARYAAVYSGLVSPVDHNVVDRGMSTGHALFTITLERDVVWELGDIQTGEPYGKSLLNYGGTYILPNIYGSQGTVSRIPTVVIRTAKEGFIKKMWMGIKPNVIGFDSFDPLIACGQDGSASIRIEDARIVADADNCNGGYKVVVNFGKTSDWATRFKLPITKWNSTTSASEANRTRYIGDYHLIMRYSCYGDADGRFGVRAGTGWYEGAALSWGNRLYLGPTLDTKGVPQWRYEDLGIISIGKGRWNQEVKDRLVMGSFAIRIQLTKTDGDNNFRVAFDDMVLVPADHFLFFSADAEMGPTQRAEIYTDQSLESFGYIVESGSEDAIGKPLGSKRKVFYSISNLTTSNWGIPVEAGSVLVTVGDRDENHTKDITSSNRIDLSVKKRTEAFTSLNA